MQAESGSPSRCGCALAAVVVLRGLLAAVRCFADDACSVGPGGASLHNNMKLALFLSRFCLAAVLFREGPRLPAICSECECVLRCDAMRYEMSGFGLVGSRLVAFGCG